MSDELAFLMINMGMVEEGDFVYDPFFGTGSILTSASYFKAYCFGSDIDVRVVRGTGVGRKSKNKIAGLEKLDTFDCFTNFRHYKQPLPDICVLDNSMPMLGLGKRSGMFDAIICDPPYGFRAETKQVGFRAGKNIEEITRQNQEEQ